MTLSSRTCREVAVGAVPMKWKIGVVAVPPSKCVPKADSEVPAVNSIAGGPPTASDCQSPPISVGSPPSNQPVATVGALFSESTKQSIQVKLVKIESSPK